jgi:type VI secretion system protein ImpL
VFREITERNVNEMVKFFQGDGWVWGEQGAPSFNPVELSAALMDAYERDYIAAWDAIVNDIEPVPLAGLIDTKEALAILAGPTSPLRSFLATVREHTRLVQEAAPAQAASETGLGGRIRERVLGGRSDPIAPAAAPAGAQITEHFAPLHRLLEGDAGRAPIDSVLQRLHEIQQRLEPIGGGVGQTNPLDPSAIRGMGELVNAVTRDSASLPTPVRTVATEVAGRALGVMRSVGRGTLENVYQQVVVRECQAVTANRYPFDPASSVDVPLEDFGRLFGYGGLFDTFFNNELAPLVDMSREVWSWRTDPTGAAVGPLGMLRQFQAADQIRERFFRRGSQSPEVRFWLASTFLDARTQRFVLDLDGQTLENRHDPERQVPFEWPGKVPGPAAATFEERGGGRPSVVARGPWAWFRLLERARVERVSDLNYELTFEAGSHEARVMLIVATDRNPFGKRDLQQFRCNP